jgi:isochorismate synthase
LEDFFKCIETQYKKQLPFVVYSKPRESKVNAWLQHTNDLHFVNDFTEEGFVFAPFDDAENSVILLLESSEVISTSFIIPDEAKRHTPSNTVPLEAKQHHINLVNKGVEAIKGGAFKKVVLSRQETVNLTETNPISIFKKLLSNYASAFVYCWYHPKSRVVVGRNSRNPYEN